MQTEVYTVNAFTYQNQGGNPAGVVVNADPLNTDQMQKVASKMGYPETAFVCTPAKNINADLTVRFFTPLSEVDFCGHATLATFYLLWYLKILSAGNYIQATKAGLLNVCITDNGQVIMDQQAPQFMSIFPAQTIAPLLGLPINAINLQLHPQKVSTGLPDLFVAVTSGYLQQVMPDLSAISELSRQHSLTGLHVFELTSEETHDAICRNFAPRFGIDEEAATGSSSGALACYLQRLYFPQKTDYSFLQGQSLGLESEINVSLTIADNAVTQVKAFGTATLIKRQTL